MALYMDVHNLPGVTAEEVAKAHAADLATQDEFGADYQRYWVNEQQGKVFCLIEAESTDAAINVHRKAHGLVADEIFLVEEGS
jgi:hypothetical protein